jgi:hypothetical protein
MPDLFEQLKQKYQGWTTALDSGCVVVRGRARPRSPQTAGTPGPKSTEVRNGLNGSGH